MLIFIKSGFNLGQNVIYSAEIYSIVVQYLLLEVFQKTKLGSE
jgi:hypothetical protein